MPSEGGGGDSRTCPSEGDIVLMLSGIISISFRTRCGKKSSERRTFTFCSIFMRGVAKVHWTESRSTGTRLGSYTEHYNAEVEYFFKRQVLFGGGK